MTVKPRAFLDTSALFSGVWSEKGGARMILLLGEAGSIEILVSPRVLMEIEQVIRQKAPEVLGVLALLLDRSNVTTIPAPGDESLKQAHGLLNHPADAAILASALQTNCDYFVTLDRKHFLENLDLIEKIPFPLGTPGDFLEWYRAWLQNI